MKIYLSFKNTILLLIIYTLASCIAQEPSSTRKIQAAKVNDNDTEVDEPKFPRDDIIYWHDSNLKQEIITINENIKTVLYLRGIPIHRFLSKNNAYNENYCMVISLPNVGVKRQLRSRIVPITFYNNSDKTKEWLFRVDIASKNSNSSVCSGTIALIDKSGHNGINISNSSTAFIPSEICSQCAGIINTLNVSIYKIENSIISNNSRINPKNLDLSSVKIRINFSNTSNQISSSSKCNNAFCKSQGFDCCLENQCVKDGTFKPNASSLPDYQQAIAEVAISPNLFTNWPNIYYICAIDTNTRVPDENQITDDTLQRQISDYECLKEGKKTTPDFLTNNLCHPNFDMESYKKVRASVWKKCGCNANPFPTEPSDPRCPDFTLKAIKNSMGEITKIICHIEETTNEETPILPIREINVPVRSAPHRFFRERDGAAIDDISKIEDKTTKPEGTPFYYLDENEHTNPQNNSFNINAITGQFDITLTKSMPAKVVRVEIGQTYTISTIKGFYTPCQDCSPDSWYQSFQSHPPSQKGEGVIPAKYSNSRMEFQNNRGLGNYEDNLFGRACFVPVTMLPFSHKRKNLSSIQRRNRLKAQLAMYINGYQRDWYGFNKGALIGSFNGINWFAIGKNRKVKAISNKLFLAINAAFSDLAEPSDLTVSINVDNGNSIAPEIDYDPNRKLSSPLQNTAASCQKYHQCNTDSDCITQLGWEYMCIDISNYRTHWPRFDSEANEKTNDELSKVSIISQIQGGIINSNKNNNKRCVYRGSGSICKRDYTNGLDDKFKKMFTCAPNFYCASLNENRFNNQVVRSLNLLSNILYGQDSDVLGRPLNYVTAKENLPSEAIENIIYNSKIYTNYTQDIGLCRPGKFLGTPLIQQHQGRDTALRTDYISQLSSCPSDETGLSRVISCPLIQTQENQEVTVGDYLFNSANNQAKNEQNSCGSESYRLNTSGEEESIFSPIEMPRLSSVGHINSPSLVADACMRRAGAICHTDLECTPNILHYRQIEFLDYTNFESDAEYNYFSEHLSCSQSDDPSFKDYNLNKNKCCREIGKTLTMFTQDSNKLFTDSNVNNDNLNVLSFSYLNPRANSRYSRYSITNPQRGANISRGGGIANTAVYMSAPIVEEDTVPKDFQWKTIYETGNKTCCGTWIRKFSDKTHDWSNSSAYLDFNVKDFTCLNYVNNLAIEAPSEVSLANYQKDVNKLCLEPSENGCAQLAILESSGFQLQNPSNNTRSTAILDTSTFDNSNGLTVQRKSVDIPFMPSPYPNTISINTNDLSGPYNYFANNNWKGVSFYLPLYIGGIQNINNVSIVYKTAGSPDTIITASDETGSTTNCPDFPANFSNPVNQLPVNSWCIRKDVSGLFDIFHIRANTATWDTAGVQIDFNVYNGSSYCYGPALTCSTDASKRSVSSGNDLYYLTKLSRFELLGIPQIFYEPIYCTSDRSKLIKGIFDVGGDTRVEFDTESFIYDENINGRHLREIYDNNNNTDVLNTNSRIVFDNKISLPKVFSANEFICCAKLGSQVTESEKCCSSYSQKEDDKNICKLPQGTNLNVYFNKFVSGEGIGDDLPLGGLKDNDFIPETGEPKLSELVYNKLQALGEEYCSDGITRGGAFGYFLGEASNSNLQNNDNNDNRIYGIVDSIFDLDQQNSTGYEQFRKGLRWNHHFYCQ